MRIRADVAAGAEIVERLRVLGGSAYPIGETFELVHPNGVVGRYEDLELAFFVRAVVARSGETASEIVVA
jgi:hypothetical protein